MVAEDPDRQDRHDDPEDIDARFEEIVAGLRAEQAASLQRRREAIRRAQSQRREQGPTPNRPLEGFDQPNPWPPRRTGSGARRGESDGTNPPFSEPGPAEPTHTEPAHTEPAHTEPSAPDPSTAAPPPTPDPEASSRQEDRPVEAWRGWDAPDEEEHFVPPTPSLPAGDLHLWAIVAGLLGGPLILVLSNAFHLLSAPWWTPVGILLSVAGVVLLVLRLPKDRDDDDFTGGARV